MGGMLGSSEWVLVSAQSFDGGKELQPRFTLGSTDV
jgi:hypothetical protein